MSLYNSSFCFGRVQCFLVPKLCSCKFDKQKLEPGLEHFVFTSLIAAFGHTFLGLYRFLDVSEFLCFWFFVDLPYLSYIHCVFRKNRFYIGITLSILYFINWNHSWPWSHLKECFLHRVTAKTKDIPIYLILLLID